jgi:hypothetical protein
MLRNLVVPYRHANGALLASTHSLRAGESPYRVSYAAAWCSAGSQSAQWAAVRIGEFLKLK